MITTVFVAVAACCKLQALTEIAIGERVWVTSYYEDHDIERQQEFIQCISKNVQNIFIDWIVLLVDREHDLSTNSPSLLAQQCNQNDNFRNKVQMYLLKHFARNDQFQLEKSAYLYSEILSVTQQLPDRIVTIANADIYADDSIGLLSWLSFAANRRKLYALSRYNLACPNVSCEHAHCEPTLCTDDKGYSFDTFTFVPPIPQAIISRVNHPQNALGAENLLLWHFEANGFELSNPCKSVLTYHLHCKRNVSLYLNQSRVDGDGHFVRIAPSV